MKHKILLLVHSLLFCLVIFSSCKKDKDSNEKSTFNDCKLIEMSNPDIDMTVELTYNSENKIFRLYNVANASYVDIIYGDSTVTSVTYNKEGKETARNISFFDNAGREVKLVHEDNWDDSFITDTAYYSYDPDGYCTQALHHSKTISGPNKTVLVYSYVYKYVISDGNVIKFTHEDLSPNSTGNIYKECTYEYYSGIENKSRIDQYGRPNINGWRKVNKNPVKKITILQKGKEPASESFYYKYNSNGYITEISKSINDGSPEVERNLLYECK